MNLHAGVTGLRQSKPVKLGRYELAVKDGGRFVKK